MTKRLHISAPSAAPEAHSDTDKHGLGLAFLAGCAIALSFGIASKVHDLPLAGIAAKFTDTLQQTMAEAPHVFTPLKGNWPDWLTANALAPAVAGKPAIAIVIDDLGLDETLTRQAIALPDAVTLAFLPGPPASLPLSRSARVAGHEIVLHVAMEATDGRGSGPTALRNGLGEPELARRLDWAMSRVAGYGGVSNHLGSRFTASRPDLAPVMRKLSARGLYFLDSRSTPDTQAEAVARETGLLTGARDVFIQSDNPSAVRHALVKIEEQAREQGSVIAVVHPNETSLAGLKTWTKETSARGFRLVPLRTMLELRARMQRVASLPASTPP